MKGQANTLAFIDLLFNLLLGITFMFILAYLLINPISEDGKVDPPVELMVEMTWPDHSRLDMDLWVRGPNNVWVGYTSRESGYMILERDDLGSLNDTFTVNGQEIVVQRNYEVVNVTALPPGEYVINTHYYTNKGDPVLVKIKVTRLNPYSAVFQGEVMLTPKQEHTMLTFVVTPDGKITDLRNDVQIPLRNRQ